MTLSEQGFVYLVGFSSGVVKIGKAVNFERRLEQHRLYATAHRVQIVNYLSAHVPNMDEAEERLINAFWPRFPHVAGREYFEADFGQALELFDSTVKQNGGATTSVAPQSLGDDVERAAVELMAQRRGNVWRRRAYTKYYGPKIDDNPHYRRLLNKSDHLYCVTNEIHCRPECWCSNSIGKIGFENCTCTACVNKRGTVGSDHVPGEATYRDVDHEVHRLATEYATSASELREVRRTAIVAELQELARRSSVYLFSYAENYASDAEGGHIFFVPSNVRVQAMSREQLVARAWIVAEACRNAKVTRRRWERLQQRLEKASRQGAQPS